MSNITRRAKIIYGVEIWLRSQGLRTTTRTVSTITYDFLKSKHLPRTKYNRRYKGLFTADICNAELVGENFKEFKEFVTKNLEKYEKK